jgi:hypothetical protein
MAGGTSDLITFLSHESGLVLGMAIGLQALALIFRTLIDQTAKTRQLKRALEGSKPSERPDIIVSLLGRRPKRKRGK